MVTETIDLDDFHNDDNESNETVVNLEDDEEIVNNSEEEIVDNEDDVIDIENIEVLTGIEKYLTTHGIEGGMIDFEDGVRKHYSDLTQDEQFNVLKTIAESEKSTIEEQFKLENDEINLLNFVRDSGKSVQDAINDIVEAEISKRNIYGIDHDVDILKMTSDAVYLKWLKDSDPDISNDDLQESLEAAKKTKTFEKQAETLRKGFIQDKERMIEVEESRLEQERLRELNSDREAIVNEVIGISNVAGWEISDDQKNAVLANLLETNSHGDSLFMEKVFSDPKKLFEVAWMEMFGNEYYDKMGEYYKNEISNAFARGKKEGVGGLSSAPISTSSNSRQKTNPANPAKREETNARSIEDLHNEED